METGTIIALVAMLVSAVGLLLTSRKGTREDAAGAARLETKLDSISSGVEDIRVEIRTMRDRMTNLQERMSAVENSCKSAHHRLDMIEGGKHS